MVPEKVTDITGLSNDLLENQSRFKPESVNLLKLFLENLPQPICLVAHNGSRYDYPLLQAELVNTGTVLNMTLQVTYFKIYWFFCQNCNFPKNYCYRFDEFF